MNWIDFVILGVAATGVFVGWRIGFLGAIFTTIGVVIGMFLAGQLAAKVSEALTDSVSSDTLATALAYLIIVGGSVAAALMVRNIIKNIMSFVFLGWIDSVGSLALGFVAGVLLAGALITFAARYSQDLPQDNRLAFALQMTGIQGSVNDGLVESQLVPVWLDLVDALPADALGLVPDDLQLALEALDERIQHE